MVVAQAIPHSIDAIKVSQHLAHAFIEAARRSTHRPESEEEELEMQIYNIAPVFTAKDVVMEPSYDGMRADEHLLFIRVRTMTSAESKPGVRMDAEGLADASPISRTDLSATGCHI